jgi:hypothetical protein
VRFNAAIDARAAIAGENGLEQLDALLGFHAAGT